MDDFLLQENNNYPLIPISERWFLPRMPPVPTNEMDFVARMLSRPGVLNASAYNYDSCLITKRPGNSAPW